MSQDTGNISEQASLILVGTGIKCISHLTTEAKAYIQKSSKVLYLVNEPGIELWIQKNNHNAESLYFLYRQYPLRLQCYQAITKYILDAVRQTQHVCVVIYGHPTVFAQPGLAAIKQARHEGFYTSILPGISAEDCLFADLLIDPGEYGCQSFEATDFLIRMRPYDSTCHLILWQVGVIGVLGHIKQNSNQGIICLMEYLLTSYPETHTLIIYEAAQYPHIAPQITEVSLVNLPQATFSSLSTLYVPPIKKRPLHKGMLNKLGINRNDLKL